MEEGSGTAPSAREIPIDCGQRQSGQLLRNRHRRSQFAAYAKRSRLLQKAKFEMVSKLQHSSTFCRLPDFRPEKAFSGLESWHCRGWTGRHKTVPIASTSGGGLITIGTASPSAPLYAGQRFPVFSLQPIRSGECANDPARLCRPCAGRRSASEPHRRMRPQP
jgi:hypothetical protein